MLNKVKAILKKQSKSELVQVETRRIKGYFGNESANRKLIKRFLENGDLAFEFYNASNLDNTRERFTLSTRLRFDNWNGDLLIAGERYPDNSCYFSGAFYASGLDDYISVEVFNKIKNSINEMCSLDFLYSNESAITLTENILNLLQECKSDEFEGDIELWQRVIDKKKKRDKPLVKTLKPSNQ
ncbi:MAG: hypothetical protein FWD82_09765 [Defluviitaleaceae bacterium]|nr:hypothetical protein [Defluviitaleaceae bacterium]